MTQIGRQPDHLARWVLAGPVPAHHRAHREGVAQIVDARAAPMLAVWLRSPEPDLLAGPREVVAGAAVGQPRGLVGDEQRPCRMADQPVTLAKIGDPAARRRLDRAAAASRGRAFRI